MTKTQPFSNPFLMPKPLPLGRIEVGGKPVANGGYLNRRDEASISEIQYRIQSALKSDNDHPAEEIDKAEAIEELLVVCLCLMLWHMQKGHP